MVDARIEKEIDAVGEKKVYLGSLLDYGQKLLCLFIGNICAKVETAKLGDEKFEVRASYDCRV